MPRRNDLPRGRALANGVSSARHRPRQVHSLREMLHVLPEKGACFGGMSVMFENTDKFYLKTLNAYLFQLTAKDETGKYCVRFEPDAQQIELAVQTLTRGKSNDFYLESGEPTDGLIMLCATDYNAADRSVYAVIQRVDYGSKTPPELYAKRMTVAEFSDLAARFHEKKTIAWKSWTKIDKP